MTRFTRRHALIGALAVLAVLGVVAYVMFGSSQPRALIAPADVRTEANFPLKVREVGYFGFGRLGARGHLPIHILSAQLLGVPDGMKVEGFYFVSVKQLRNSPITATDAIRPYLRPVDSVTFRKQSDDKWWTLMAGAYAIGPGHYKTKGLRVCYEAGGRRGCESYMEVVELDVSARSG